VVNKGSRNLLYLLHDGSGSVAKTIYRLVGVVAPDQSRLSGRGLNGPTRGGGWIGLPHKASSHSVRDSSGSVQQSWKNKLESPM